MHLRMFVRVCCIHVFIWRKAHVLASTISWQFILIIFLHTAAKTYRIYMIICRKQNKKKLVSTPLVVIATLNMSKLLLTFAVELFDRTACFSPPHYWNLHCPHHRGRAQDLHNRSEGKGTHSAYSSKIQRSLCSCWSHNTATVKQNERALTVSSIFTNGFVRLTYLCSHVILVIIDL